MKKVSLLVCLCIVIAFETACPNTPYGKAGEAGLNVTQALHTGADIVDQLQVVGAITVTEEKETLHAMDALNTLDMAYGACIQAAHVAGSKAGAFVACAEIFQAGTKDSVLMKELRVSDPHSQAVIRSIGQTVVDLLANVISTLGK